MTSSGVAVGAAPPARGPASAVPASAPPADATHYESLWEALSSVTVPVLLARGTRPDSVLDDEGERELLRRLPGTEVVHVEEAGHSLQGDTPLELAEIIDRFVYRRFVNDRFVWGSSVTSKQTAPSLPD